MTAAQVTAVKPVSRREVFKRFLAEKRDPEPFYDALVERSMHRFPFPLEGARVLDLGSGPGHFSRAMADAGASVLAIEQDESSLPIAPRGCSAARGDAENLPLRDASFDGVFCSNMLEHTPQPEAVFAEIERIVRPGGWAWVSWTNWYSPWGGHAITPLHYLGPSRGLTTYRRLFGEPKGHNIPYQNLWPTSIGRILDQVRARPGLRLVDAVPRYYPSQRWITRVPGLREVATWNCLLLIERKEASS
jgi:SAM-dependent methyltransferase